MAQIVIAPSMQTATIHQAVEIVKQAVTQRAMRIAATSMRRSQLVIEVGLPGLHRIHVIFVMSVLLALLVLLVEILEAGRLLGPARSPGDLTEEAARRPAVEAISAHT